MCIYIYIYTTYVLYFRGAQAMELAAPALRADRDAVVVMYIKHIIIINY